jgi:hypothetical protein
VVEPFGDCLRGHLAAARVQHADDRPPGPVRQRAEYRVQVVEICDPLRLQRTTTFS